VSRADCASGPENPRCLLGAPQNGAPTSCAGIAHATDDGYTVLAAPNPYFMRLRANVHPDGYTIASNHYFTIGYAISLTRPRRGLPIVEAQSSERPWGGGDPKDGPQDVSSKEDRVW